MRSAFMKIVVILALALSTLQPVTPAFAKPKGCPTPDGFIFASGKGMGGTGIHDGKGMGGTGAKFAEGKGMGGTGILNGKGMGGTGAKFADRGIGGTGITGDIGVYGRVTGFGSICVNGMEIEYTTKTPVENNGRNASIQALRVGQVVAVRAYNKNGEFRARKITVDKAVSGRVGRVNAKRGEMIVGKQKVIADGKGRAVMKLLKPGDYVSVSGMKRADGVIIAGLIERMKPAKTGSISHVNSIFKSGVKHFLTQGYVREYNNGALRLADGTKISLAVSARKAPEINSRVIVFGDVGANGSLVAQGFMPETAPFSLGLIVPVLKGIEGQQGGIGGGLPTQLGSLPLPSIAETGIHVPSVDVPAVDVPAVDVPPVDLPLLPPVDLPPVDVPVIDVPALPPVDIPIPPVIPDLPIIH